MMTTIYCRYIQYYCLARVLTQYVARVVLSGDKEIYCQYQAMANIKNITYMQDTLTKAKETALKIIQKTVYGMIEKFLNKG